MKNIICCAMFTLLIFGDLMSNAQIIKPLKIGERIPDIVLAKMLNHKTKSGKLSDFNGKAIIIDQWFIGCIPCVSGMPHLDSLQKEFSKDLQILPVTFEKKSDVQEFWSSNLLVRGIRFAQVVEDNLIKKYFPVVSYPQQIWINKDRQIVAITDGTNATRVNIKKLINNEKLDLRQKKDEMDATVRYSDLPSIMVRFDDNKSKLLNYSYFSKYRKEFGGFLRTNVDTSAKIVRVTAANASLYWLYDFAYSNGSWEPRNFSSRFIRKDSRPYNGIIKSPDDTASMFCYDLMYPGTKADNFSKVMVADLDKFLNIKSHEELQDVLCYVISPTGAGNKFSKKYDETRKRFYTVDLQKLKKVVANDSYVWSLVSAINDQSNSLILFELGDIKRVNFEADWDLKDLDKMNNDLLLYDLKIEKTYRKRKVIIVEDL